MLYIITYLERWIRNMDKMDKEIELFVPGRLCLFGEHTDWAGRYTDINADLLPGLAIVTGIDLGIYGTAKKAEDFSITSIDATGETVSFRCDMDMETLKKKAKEPHFFSYACGVAAFLSEHYQIGGLSITVGKATLPIKKGLSSSASICVFVARAFNEAYLLKMSTNGEMQAAYRGELLTTSRCGRLDQACAYGVRPVSMEFNGDEISIEKLKVGANLHWVFADLNAGKDTVKILSDLNRAYPFAQTQRDKMVHEALGADNRAIVKEAIRLIAQGETEKIGALMTRAQQIFDEKVAPACISELAAPKLHSVLNDETVKALSFGGKGVGSQGDGTIQFIARDKETQEKLASYLNDELGLTAYTLTLPSSDSVRKAIIPLAGFGTRMYPASRFIKKAFFPVVDDGVVKPVIMCLLEELMETGIDEIILIVGAEEVDQYNEFFGGAISDQHVNKLPERVREYERLIAKIGKKIKYAVQEERRGFGHAVYQARQYLENEPVLLLLGDFIYKSYQNLTCALQTINAYRMPGGFPVVAIKEIPLGSVVHYGVLAGEFDDKRNGMMAVHEIAEKPTVEYAKDFLSVKTRTNKVSYFATFGQYVLTPAVFDELEADIAEQDRTGGSSEIELTSALKKVLDKEGLTAVLVDGASFDVGLPEAYMVAMANFGMK